VWQGISNKMPQFMSQVWQWEIRVLSLRFDIVFNCVDETSLFCWESRHFSFGFVMLFVMHCAVSYGTMLKERLWFRGCIITI